MSAGHAVAAELVGRFKLDGIAAAWIAAPYSRDERGRADTQRREPRRSHEV